MKRAFFHALLVFLPLQLFAQTPSEWQAHRAELLRHLSEKSVAILKANPEYLRNGDVEYDYRQSSNFYYLTGVPEKESMLILAPSGINVRELGRRVKEILFVMPRNPMAETWEGIRLGPQGAKEQLGFEAVFTNDRFEEFAERALANADTIYMETERASMNAPLNESLDFIKRARERFPNVVVADPRKMLHPMREIKSAGEIALLRKAITITCVGHREVMRSAQAGMREYELQAMLEYVFTQNGSERLGFPSIVGSGPNSCILHYRAGNRVINRGEVIVIDLGAEYGMYTADVTRTIPISGKFTKEQAAIYQIVYDAQEAAFQKIKPGAAYREPHEASARVVTEGLLKLGILKGTVEENLKSRAYAEFFLHGSNHYIGLDVHDVGTYGPLKPGVLITVEPGIYISEATAQKHGLDKKYVNIGVRIEDDVLVTPTGYELLSGSAPRSIAEIEALMAETGKFEN
ncbi:MAG: aminopeptidase P N-terminal domain-containing protein [candidate division KSB1 bacterium]